MRRFLELFAVRHRVSFRSLAASAQTLAQVTSLSLVAALAPAGALRADPVAPAKHGAEPAKPTAASANPAAGPSLAGFWNVYEDDDKRPDAVFFFYEKDGQWEGRLVKSEPPPGEPAPDPLCRHCPGEKKDKPMLGLVLVWGMKPHGEAKFESGHILDPRNGTVWNAQLEVTPDNQKLLVRGYVMTPMLGQTRTWVRAPDDTMALADIPGDPFPGQPAKKPGHAAAPAVHAAPAAAPTAH